MPVKLRAASFLLLLTALPVLAGTGKVPPRENDGTGLLVRSRLGRKEKYAAFEKAGGKIIPTDDGRSFYLLYLPRPDAPVIVALHGLGGFAIDRYTAWRDSGVIEGKNVGLLCLQWSSGDGADATSFYRPPDVFNALDRAIVKSGLGNRKLALEGFGQGSENIYGVAAIDQDTRSNHFSLFIANAGGAAMDFPINRDIEDGKFGDNPFEGTDWILFCGGNDPNPERDGCSGMRRTSDWIKDKGGDIRLLIEDPAADNNGFLSNPANAAQAVALFLKN